MDVLQIMGVGIVDDLTAVQIGIFLLQSLQIVQISHLGTGEMTVRGNEPQIVQQAVGILVDVGRDHDAAELLHDVLRRRKGDLGTADEQIFHLARRFVVLIVNDLPPEQVFPVGKRQQPLIHIGVKIHGTGKLREQAQHMHLLHGRQLHARDNGNPVLLCRLHDGRTVFAGIMIRQRDHIQPF